MANVYRSKVDTWLLAVLVSAMALCIYASVTALRSGSPATWWIVLITVGVGVGLPLWLLVATRYTLDSKLLLVQSRSEEHTSELQSRENLVCRLLLEKKKGMR